ncbi:MAG: hypothetical protein ACD_48C00109G0002 [uncultured bacterium]|nr:MAG: hypothetical protein ACD_48C00109G0002 [uncultured bacterium]
MCWVVPLWDNSVVRLHFLSRFSPSEGHLAVCKKCRQSEAIQDGFCDFCNPNNPIQFRKPRTELVELVEILIDLGKLNDVQKWTEDWLVVKPK